MKLVLELPDKTMCVFANYIYVKNGEMVMGVAQIDGDDLLEGKKICKGARGYEESRSKV